VRICLVASSRYPVREPFAGGLESLTHHLARLLAARGHEVSLFAADCDPDLPVHHLAPDRFVPTGVSMRDVNAPSHRWMADHHAYLGLMLDLARDGAERFDVVHNHSLHHLPVAMAGSLPIPVLTTLHTPPLPWIESAAAVAPDASSWTAVSRATARAWSGTLSARPVLNGVDVDAWRPGPGGGPIVWTGRLVPEKAPHLAIDAARAAGREIVLAGPVQDIAYVAREVTPRLGPGARMLGHLDHAALARLLARASVALVTPAWEEPYGLVAAEAMSCGTPVAAFARGALPEVVVPGTGALAEPDDVDALAEAIELAAACDRREVRAHAERSLSAERMVREYEQVYDDLVVGEQAA
jgi:glycosyltransferase involved in cell wall biosynthesis